MSVQVYSKMLKKQGEICGSIVVPQEISAMNPQNILERQVIPMPMAVVAFPDGIISLPYPDLVVVDADRFAGTEGIPTNVVEFPVPEGSPILDEQDPSPEEPACD